MVWVKFMVSTTSVSLGELSFLRSYSVTLLNIVTPNPDMIQFDYQRTLSMEAENGGNAKVSLDIQRRQGTGGAQKPGLTP